jgi:hypothetical protein
MNIDQKLTNIVKLVKKLKQRHSQWAKELCQLEDKAIDASNAADDFLTATSKIIGAFPEWKPVYKRYWIFIEDELLTEVNYWDDRLANMEEQVDMILTAHDELNRVLTAYK